VSGPENAAIAERLEAFATMLDLAGSDSWAPRAYRRAAELIRATPAAVEELVRAVERDAPISDVITMEQAVAEQFAQPRFYLLVFAGFAGVALVLAVVGVYGVISYSVVRRTREIGLRVALGASPRGPFRLVVGQGMRLAVVGIVLGLATALGVARYLRSVLFEVQPTDPVTLATAAAVLAATALAACSVPAWRASKVDPMVALRSD
jgi:putative ABC transport system permease protein